MVDLQYPCLFTRWYVFRFLRLETLCVPQKTATCFGSILIYLNHWFKDRRSTWHVRLHDLVTFVATKFLDDSGAFPVRMALWLCTFQWPPSLEAFDPELKEWEGQIDTTTIHNVCSCFLRSLNLCILKILWFWTVVCNCQILKSFSDAWSQLQRGAADS